MSGSNGIRVMKKFCKDCKELTEWSYTGSFNQLACNSCGGDSYVVGHARHERRRPYSKRVKV